MNIPIDIISLIISYIPKKTCYRCNKHISPIDERVLYSNNIFCSTFCTEYQHY